MVSPGSPSKKQHFSPAGTRAANAYSSVQNNGATQSGISRATRVAKEGKWAVQVLYPEKMFELGANNVVVYIKVIHYCGQKIQVVYQFNNDTFADSFKDVAMEMMKIKSGFPWLDFAVGQMNFQELRGIPHGPNAMAKHQDTWPILCILGLPWASWGIW